MPGYLDGYGTKEIRRARIRNRILIGLSVAAVVGIACYFQFRNYSEEQRVKLFLQQLQDKQYQQAYSLWGCTEANPCRDYNFSKFLEDWGPDSTHAVVADAKLGRTRSCTEGIIQPLQYPNDEVLLWVNRNNLTIGFAPWPVCNPRLPTPQMQ
jgi:hypothetical protein